MLSPFAAFWRIKMNRILLLIGLSFVTVGFTQAGFAQAGFAQASIAQANIAQANIVQSTTAAVSESSTLWPAHEQLGPNQQTGQLFQPQANWGQSSPPPRWGGGR
jgi:uncharacterized protein YjbI with pentapeptide repeats